MEVVKADRIASNIERLHPPETSENIYKTFNEKYTLIISSTNTTKYITLT